MLWTIVHTHTHAHVQTLGSCLYQMGLLTLRSLRSNSPGKVLGPHRSELFFFSFFLSLLIFLNWTTHTHLRTSFSLSFFFLPSTGLDKSSDFCWVSWAFYLRLVRPCAFHDLSHHPRWNTTGDLGSSNRDDVAIMGAPFSSSFSSLCIYTFFSSFFF